MTSVATVSAAGVDFGTFNSSAALARADGSVEMMMPKGSACSCIRSRFRGDHSGSRLVFEDEGSGKEMLANVKRRVKDGAQRHLVHDTEELCELGLAGRAAQGLLCIDPLVLWGVVVDHVMKCEDVPDGTTLVVAAPYSWKVGAQVKAAVERMGYAVAEVLSEGVAVAIAHARAVFDDGASASDWQSMLVLDWGGGTLDLAVVFVSRNGQYEDLAQSSHDVGGVTIDEKIVERLKAELHKTTGKSAKELLDREDGEGAERRLLDYARRGKEYLGTPGSPSCYSHLGARDADLEDDIPALTGCLTRAVLDDVLRPFFEALMEDLAKLWKNARRTNTTRMENDKNLPPLDKARTHVVLSGGSSALPGLREFLVSHCGDFRGIVDRTETSSVEGAEPTNDVSVGCALRAQALRQGVSTGERRILAEPVTHVKFPISVRVHESFRSGGGASFNVFDEGHAIGRRTVWIVVGRFGKGQKRVPEELGVVVGPKQIRLTAPWHERALSVCNAMTVSLLRVECTVSSLHAVEGSVRHCALVEFKGQFLFAGARVEIDMRKAAPVANRAVPETTALVSVDAEDAVVALEDALAAGRQTPAKLDEDVAARVRGAAWER